MQKMEIFRRVMVKLTGNSEDQLKENRHHYTQHGGGVQFFLEKLTGVKESRELFQLYYVTIKSTQI